MRLKAAFLDQLLDALVEKFDTDEIEGRVVEEVAKGINEEDVVKQAAEDIASEIRDHEVLEAVVEKLVDDIDTDDIVEAVAERLIETLMDHDDEFKEDVAERLANRIFMKLIEEETEPARVEAPVPPVAIQETVPTRHEGDLARSPASCPRCGGSVFLHRNGTCPLQGVSS